MTATHEANPPRTAIERVICRLSIQTATIGRQGGSGIPEFTTSDIAAAAAGYNDPVGRYILGVLIEDPRDVGECVEALNRHGWLRWLTDGRTGNIDAALHRRMCEAAVAELQNGEGWPYRALTEYFQIGYERLQKLMPHYLTLVRILNERKGDLGQHVARRLRRRDAA